MLTGWKVSCLACKYVFYRPEHNSKGSFVQLSCLLPESWNNLLTWISSLYLKFANFWYITCSVPNLIPISP